MYVNENVNVNLVNSKLVKKKIVKNESHHFHFLIKGISLIVMISSIIMPLITSLHHYIKTGVELGSGTYPVC